MSAIRDVLANFGDKLSSIHAGGIQLRWNVGTGPNSDRMFFDLNLVDPCGVKIRTIASDWAYINGGSLTMYGIPEALSVTWSTNFHPADLPPPLREYVDAESQRLKTLNYWLDDKDLGVTEVEEPAGKAPLLTRIRERFGL